MSKTVTSADTPKKPPIRNLYQISNNVPDPPIPVLSSKHLTPRSHRKSSSLASSSPSNSKLSPGRSRFDYSYLPSSGLDVRACEDQFARCQKLEKQKASQERSSSKEEWYHINTKRKQELELDLKQHESFQTKQRTGFQKDLEDKAKLAKQADKEEKEKDFEEVKSVKNALKKQEREKAKKTLLDEYEKIQLSRRERETEKERLKAEREEKRKWRLEEIEALKRRRDEEKLRDQREREYERQQYAVGLKNLMTRQCDL